MGKRYHIWVSGRVQGVGFRWYARDIGQACRVAGWVKNLSDGRVEIVAEGEEENLTNFLAELQSGYLGRNIREVAHVEEEYQGEPKEFSIAF